MPKLINVTKKYGYSTVFDRFSLDFEEGMTTVIMGGSGVGKTTLLNILANITDYEGTVDAPNPVSYVFQSSRLIESMTVKENLLFVLKNSGLSAEQGLKKIIELLNVAEISNKINAFPKNLSGGQRQRVSLVRAFAFPSELLLMDEPFTSLDLALKMRLMQLYRDLLRESPRTVVLVTHDVDEALYLADRIIVLGENKVLLQIDMEKAPDGQLRDLSASSAVAARADIYKSLTQK